MSDEKSKGMKSAYELALERLEAQGIERPDASNLSDEARAEMAEARSRAVARLAELEILHRQAMARESDPVLRQEAESEYHRERRRVEEERDRALRRLRGS